ncbi:hypothetical protein JAAARDRAFT_543880 [Jaapia argillacea MUCL 33604]|uniref:Uncharacterized protein n=1 Tax=Jaapia argillacea MUCL 33604 TaxID=933084 RepID=A0A067P7X9_9AGAM|nr:hypothetical protein JAAARDRAFT_543880 [Jaapia argillacea MUCL 33604]
MAQGHNRVAVGGFAFHGAILYPTNSRSISHWWRTWFLGVLTLTFSPILVLFALVCENGSSALRLLLASEQDVFISPHVLASAILTFYFYVSLILFVVAWRLSPETFVFDRLWLPTNHFYRARSHISRLRLDRFRQLTKMDLSTLFVRLDDRSVQAGERQSVPLQIGQHTTVQDILNNLRHRQLLPMSYLSSHYLVAPGARGRPLALHEQIGHLGVVIPSSLSLRLRVRGGAGVFPTLF